jgi:uncharacterized protein YkwD
MSLDRRVADFVPRQHGAVEVPARDSDRLDRIPTQRGLLPEPGPVAPAPGRRRGRTVLVVVSLAVTAALVATAGVVANQRSVRVEQRQAEAARVAASLTAYHGGARVLDAAQAAGQGPWIDAVATARDAARSAAAAGTSQLAAAPHAGAPLLAALHAAVDQATATADDPTAGLDALTAAAAGVTAPAKAAQDAEAAWPAAEAARIAAEQQAAAQAAAQQAAAQQAAAQQAAARAAAQPVHRATTTRTTTTSTQAPAGGGTVQSIPAGGLVCPGAPVGAAASESSVAAIGAAINAFRQANGLPALAVVRSGTLVAHAEDMAASGGIWHSGFENIVGCTSGGVPSLVQAWANSAPHAAQMLRTGVTTMQVGGATAGGYLYGAVKFL